MSATSPGDKLQPKSRRKPYRKPKVQRELLFETQALLCGKLTGGGHQCVTIRKTS